MSFFSVDSDRLIRIFHANGLKMSLKKAFELARIIEDLHSQRVIEVENNTWDVARKEADKRVEAAFEDGYKQGKAHGERLHFFEADNAHTELVTRATIWANAEFSHYDLERKIRCIKHLRQNFPTIDLRTAKHIVQCLDGSGVGARF